MTTTHITVRSAAAGIALLAGAVTLAPSARAQDVAADNRWSGLLGCWQPVTATSADSYTAWMEQRARDAESPKLCILPTTNANAVEFVTVAGGKVTARDTVDAGNQHRARMRDTCDGWEGASWSPDRRRVYLRSEYTCDGNLARTSSGMLAMSSDGQLMQINEVASRGSKSVRVVRYQSVPAPEGITLDSTVVPRADAMRVTAARATMGGALSGADIVDVVNSVDSLVAEAWLVERGDRFVVDAKRLAALADAGVPGRITDLMVALAYPKYFALDQSQRVATALGGSGRVVYATLPPSDPFGYGGGYAGMPAGYGPLGYRPYVYDAYGFAYGFPRYGYQEYYGGYMYRPPVVVVVGSGGVNGRAHGHVVNGHGYTRDPSPSSAQTPSTRSGAGGGTTSSSGSTSSGATTSSSSGSSSSGETRQAKPRP